MGKKIALCGIGQWYRGDDSAGLEIIQRWIALHPENTLPPILEVHLLNGKSIELLQLLNGTDAALLIDCIVSKGQPGTIHYLKLQGQQIDFMDVSSSHVLGVLDAVKMFHEIPGHWPKDVRLLGVEGTQFELGTELSAAIVASFDSIFLKINEWLAEMTANTDF